MHSTGVPISIDMLEGLTLFQGLAHHRLDELAAGGWTVDHARSVRVIGRGDYIDGLYGVFEGRLKLYMLSCNGDERVLRVLQSGDTFGEAIMFNAIPSPVYVETLTSARLGYFPRELINDALANDPAFTTSMLRGMSVMMRELIQDLETCCMQTAMQRTVSYLLREAQTAPPPNIEIHLPAPKSVVASTLNISAETFSRELHRLQGEGFIKIDRRTIYVRDKEGLQALVDGTTH